MAGCAQSTAPSPGPAGRGAAFFDLDRTLIRRSSMLALAPALRRHGLIGWRSLARASAWHAVYLVRGVGSRELSHVAEQTFKLMRGWPVAELRALRRAAAVNSRPVLRFASSRLSLAEAEAALLLDLEGDSLP